MKSVLVNFRMDEEKKKKMEAVCDRLGITTTAAFNLFATKMIEEDGIPFDMSAKKAEDREREAIRRFLAYQAEFENIKRKQEAEKNGNTDI